MPTLIRKTLSGALLLGGLWLITESALAQPVRVSLSQEQDGGSQGRACIYVHNGQAEFRRVKAGEACQPEIIIQTPQS